MLAYRAVDIFTTAAETQRPAQAALKKPKASKAELHGVQAELKKTNAPIKQLKVVRNQLQNRAP